MQMRAPAVRRVRISALILVAVTAAGCSHVTGSKSSKGGKPLPCTFIAKLDQIANSVAATDVRNPDTFKKTFDAAVHEYVATVRSLRAIAPSELHAGLTRVEADVQQFRFDSARTDRAALDAYAARTCGRVTNTGSTGATGVTTSSSAPTSAPTSASTGIAESTTTTAPSDG